MKFNAFVFHKLTGHQHRIKSIEAKSLKHVYLRVNKSSYFLNFFAPHSVRTTIARITIWWLKKNCKWSRIHIFFYKNLFRILATSRAITKAHHPANFTIFHCRMSSRQPAWPVSATPECLHTLCWHSCSCSSYKTIPSLRSWLSHNASLGSVCVSIGFTQVWVIMARISYKEKCYF